MMKKPVRNPTTENHVKHALRYMLAGLGIMKFNEQPTNGLWFAVAAGGLGGSGGISDSIVCYRGRMIAIEVKRPGRRGQENGGLTPLQVMFGVAVVTTGGLFFEVDDYESIDAVRRELEEL